MNKMTRYTLLEEYRVPLFGFVQIRFDSQQERYITSFQDIGKQEQLPQEKFNEVLHNAGNYVFQAVQKKYASSLKDKRITRKFQEVVSIARKKHQNWLQEYRLGKSRQEVLESLEKSKSDVLEKILELG